MANLSHINCVDEVDQPNVKGIGVDQDVVRFYAAMNNAWLMNIIDSLGELAGNGEKSV